MIELYSFEEWDAMQEQDKIIEWGSTIANETSEAMHHSCLYKEAPLEIRKMFYADYVHQMTNPNIQP